MSMSEFMANINARMTHGAEIVKEEQIRRDEREIQEQYNRTELDYLRSRIPELLIFIEEYTKSRIDIVGKILDARNNSNWLTKEEVKHRTDVDIEIAQEELEDYVYWLLRMKKPERK